VSDEIPDVKDWITSLAGEMVESRASLIWIWAGAIVYWPNMGVSCSARIL